MRFARIAIASFLSLAATRATAQQQTDAPKMPGSAVRQGDFVVKTVTLHHLSSAEAVRLLSPYSVSAGGGVFEVPNVRAVTIRETSKVYGDMMNVLEKYDREPATVVLNFQLVAAEPTNTRDPAVAGIDSLLRNVLKFSGYRLLGTAVATAGENHLVTQTIAGDTETLSLSVEVRDVRVEGNDASVNLRVSLERPAAMPTSTTPGHTRTDLLSTGVTVPIGQTVLLGTSASENGQRALILTVRPQLAKR
jgi:hypothetical protein